MGPMNKRGKEQGPQYQRVGELALMGTQSSVLVEYSKKPVPKHHDSQMGLMELYFAVALVGTPEREQRTYQEP